VVTENVVEAAAGNTEAAVPVTPGLNAVFWMWSFKTPLYFAVVLLVTGVAISVIYTVLTMDANGKAWMKSTEENFDIQTNENLKVITSAKSTVIELFFQKMTVLTFLVANYTTKLMAGNLTSADWIDNGDYLRSYSLDPNNTFAYRSSSTAFSGYYTTVRRGQAIKIQS